MQAAVIKARGQIPSTAQLRELERQSPGQSGLGLVIARDIIAPIDLPPFDNSAVDGYAVQAADTTAAPVEIDILREISSSS